MCTSNKELFHHRAMNRYICTVLCNIYVLCLNFSRQDKRSFRKARHKTKVLFARRKTYRKAGWSIHAMSMVISMQKNTIIWKYSNRQPWRMDRAWTRRYPFVYFSCTDFQHGYCMDTSTREHELKGSLPRPLTNNSTSFVMSRWVLRNDD